MKILSLTFKIACAALILTACSKSSKGRLSEGDMIDIISDIEMADSYMQTHSGAYYSDSVRDRVLAKILDRNGANKQEFDSTMTWYGKNIDDYTLLLGKVEEELDRRRKTATGKTSVDDSPDYWTYSRHYTLSRDMVSDGLNFNVPINDMAKGARINWKLRASSALNGTCMLGMVFDDGSIAYNAMQLYGQNRLDFSVQSDTAKTVKRVFGKLKLTDLYGTQLLIDSVTLRALPPDSTRYFEIGSLRRYFSPKKKIVINIAEKDSIGSESASARTEEIDIRTQSERPTGVKPTQLTKKPRPERRANAVINAVPVSSTPSVRRESVVRPGK